jgi:hypothetical protein
MTSLSTYSIVSSHRNLSSRSIRRRLTVSTPTIQPHDRLQQTSHIQASIYNLMETSNRENGLRSAMLPTHHLVIEGPQRVQAYTGPL